MINETLSRKVNGGTESLQLSLIPSENAFSILCTRFRMFYVLINATVSHMESYVKAAIALYNYLRETENALFVFKVSSTVHYLVNGDH